MTTTKRMDSYRGKSTARRSSTATLDQLVRALGERGCHVTKTNMAKTGLTASLMAVTALSGCLEVLGFKDPTLDECAPDGCEGTGGTGTTTSETGGAGGTTTSSTGGTGGGGGAGGCAVALDCPGTDTDCQVRTCTDQTCGVNNAQSGAPCDDEEGRFCDGTGNCAQCMQGNDCLSGMCDLGKCVTQLVWKKTWGDAESQFGAAVGADSEGNVLVTGRFFGSLPFAQNPLVSAGADDVFVAKLTSTGEHLWSKRFGSTDANQGGAAVAADPMGNMLVAGTYSGTIDFGGGALQAAGAADIFIAKLGSDGSHVWSQSYGSTDPDNAYALSVDVDGHVTVVGGFRGDIQFGGEALSSAGLDDIFVTKLNSFGSSIWSKRFGDVDFQRARAVAVDANKDIFVAADVWGTVDFGGGAMTTVNGEDIAIAKLDTGGNYDWAHLLTSDAPTSSAALAIDPTGSVFLAGTLDGVLTVAVGTTVTSAGGTDIFVAKFAPDGQHLWSKTFGSSGQDAVGGIAVDPAGNLVVGGSFSGSFSLGSFAITGTNDAFVAKLDGETGAASYLERFSGDGSQAVTAAVAFGFDVFLTGSFEGTTDFGTVPVKSEGQHDLFVTRLTLP